MSEPTYTPMMQQYLAVKKNYEDTILFYRIGDFYEMFFDDAITASRELDLVLTGKSAGVEEKVPMCGVPHHAYATYVQRLVQRGYKVAIVEQMEDPVEAKGIVQRDVIRIITPGTVIDEISDEKESVYLASVVDHATGYTVVFAEVSTGENSIRTIRRSKADLLSLLLRNNTREVVVGQGFDESFLIRLREMQIAISYCDKTEIKADYAPLCECLKKEYERIAYGRMLNYLEETQRHSLYHLSSVVRENENEVLYMDYSTRQNLELIEPLKRQGKSETLWTFLDQCRSCMGSRLLKKWIEKPLVRKEEITFRYDCVEALKKNFLNRRKIRDHLGNIYDVQRLIARCALNCANAQDILRLSKTLNEVPFILDALPMPEFEGYENCDRLEELATQLNGAFVDNPPATLNDGGMFRDGYNAELDQARALQKDGRNFISTLEVKERERTGIKTLKIGYNRVFGYYIEISKAAAQEVKEEWGYIRKQTLVNNERFISPELKEKEDQILHAEENAIRIEKQLFARLLSDIKVHLPALQKLSLVLSEIDVLADLAEVSSKYGYVRPEFSEDIFEVVDGKHPILDARMKNPRYVSNSVYMDSKKSILLITGPNMGGKSTYMREAALIAVMAQIGCYVPAKKCVLPVFDKIFTRIGASDDILAGQSTFMVEMKEANNALQEATEHSLILFDEIGRGTSTYDGMALAQAMLEYLASCVHAKTFFSTHYHELTALADTVDGIRNVHVAVHEEKDNVTFLYKVKEGKADRSYGINVARLAGLPESVLNRAKELQNELESKKRVVQQSFQLVEMKKEDPLTEEILKELKAVDLDNLTPRQAWDMLSDLKDLSQKSKQE